MACAIFSALNSACVRTSISVVLGSLSNRLSGVRWGVAARIVWAWIFTIPATAGLAMVLFYIFVLLM
jgi:PiT family inorganic phosphate transporter